MFQRVNQLANNILDLVDWEVGGKILNNRPLISQYIQHTFQIDMPSISAAYKNQLDQLECHFTWLKDHPITRTEVDSITKRLQNDLNISPTISIASLAFLSYLHTLPSTNMSTDTALECLAKVTQIDIDPSSVKCDFVIRANKLHISYLKGDVHHQDELALLLKEWDGRIQTLRGWGLGFQGDHTV